MTVLNVGSINLDLVYPVSRLPGAGETIASKGAFSGLGGKGLNQSLALRRAGAEVRHFGACGQGDDDMLRRLEREGIATDLVQSVPDVATGTAVILLDEDGENCIVLDAGANAALPLDLIRKEIAALPDTAWVLAQNETNGTETALRTARQRGLATVYSAAPFDVAATLPLLDCTDLLVVNEVEFDQLSAAMGDLPETLDIVITKGAAGVSATTRDGQFSAPAFPVDVVDTTGAGDTFLGYLVASRIDGADWTTALRRASAAAALSVTKAGAAASIPDRADVEAFLAKAG